MNEAIISKLTKPISSAAKNLSLSSSHSESSFYPRKLSVKHITESFLYINTKWFLCPFRTKFWLGSIANITNFENLSINCVKLR